MYTPAIILSICSIEIAILEERAQKDEPPGGRDGQDAILLHNASRRYNRA
jgi:hypothetical protein